MNASTPTINHLEEKRRVMLSPPIRLPPLPENEEEEGEEEDKLHFCGLPREAESITKFK